jgi:hypothetical protein
MKAAAGDRIVVHSSHVDQPERTGRIVEVRSADGEPPYLVQWDDGHEGLVYPGPGAVVEHAGS